MSAPENEKTVRELQAVLPALERAADLIDFWVIASMRTKAIVAATSPRLARLLDELAKADGR